MVISKLRKLHVLQSLERAISVKSFIFVTIFYTAFYVFSVFVTEEVAFHVSPLLFVLEGLMGFDELVTGGIVIVAGLVLASTNVVHFLTRKKEASSPDVGECVPG